MIKPFARTSNFADYLVAVVLVAVPLHGFLTVWGSALVSHYTLLRLWDDTALLLLAGIVGYWLARDQALRRWFSGSLLVRLVLIYVALTVLLGLVSLVKGDVVPKALGYGLVVNLRFLVWFLAVLLTAQRSVRLARWWPKLLLYPALIVAFFATFQYTVLPHNFLSHFGYNANTTIAPIETINHNPHYIRVQSTLRGANPLGAYLVVVLAALGVLLVRGQRKLICAVFGMVALFALYASGSRSAWIGTIVSLVVVAGFLLKTWRLRLLAGGVGLVVLAVTASLFLVLRGHEALQNQLLHTQDHSVVAISSNDAHVDALRSGAQDLLHQPLGDGPGTAGPASEYNTGHPVRIAENYYVQVAQETGWLGLALFLSIVCLVGMELYQRVRVSRLALALLAALAGISFVGLLSHVWTDDSVAFLWWGLAGIALAIPARVKSRETDA